MMTTVKPESDGPNREAHHETDSLSLIIKLALESRSLTRETAERLLNLHKKQNSELIPSYAVELTHGLPRYPDGPVAPALRTFDDFAQPGEEVDVMFRTFPGDANFKPYRATRDDEIGMMVVESDNETLRLVLPTYPGLLSPEDYHVYSTQRPGSGTLTMIHTNMMLSSEIFQRVYAEEFCDPALERSIIRKLRGS